jgi:hypothetical protein
MEYSKPQPPEHQPSHDEIAQRAYLLWEQRGRPQGQDLEFWSEAERQFLSTSKLGEEKLPAPARSSVSLASPAQPGSLPVPNARLTPARTGRQTAARANGGSKPGTTAAAMASGQQTKTAARTTARR